jgi:hypothetical protein
MRRICHGPTETDTSASEIFSQSASQVARFLYKGTLLDVNKYFFYSTGSTRLRNRSPRQVIVALRCRKTTTCLAYLTWLLI